MHFFYDLKYAQYQGNPQQSDDDSGMRIGSSKPPAQNSNLQQQNPYTNYLNQSMEYPRPPANSLNTSETQMAADQDAIYQMSEDSRDAQRGMSNSHQMSDSESIDNARMLEKNLFRIFEDKEHQKWALTPEDVNNQWMSNDDKAILLGLIKRK